MKTQLQLSATGGRRYGTFTAKTEYIAPIPTRDAGWNQGFGGGFGGGF